MNIIHETNYKIYNKKLSKDLIFSIINDLHFSYMTKDDKFKLIINKLEKINPNYILFPGDLLDSVDMIENLNERKRLIYWLKEISDIAPFLLSLGSHDYCKKNIDYQNTHIKWLYNYPKYFFDEINNLNNIYVLNNAFYRDNNINVFGFTQEMNYYNSHQEINHSIFNPNWENKEELLKELKYLRNLFSNISDNQINLMLIHSPVYLKDADVINFLKEYDYLVSGHMHNGCVPPIIYEIWNSSRGLIGPSRNILTDNTRNTFKKKNDKLIVNGPLTMFHENNKLFRKINFIYPSYLTNLCLTTDINYNLDKIWTNKKYTK